MSIEFNQAAASYFGLPEGTAVIPSDPGHIAFHVELTSEALAGIAARMVALALPKPDEAVAAPSKADLPLSVLRTMYNALHPTQRAEYGSFGRYATTWERGE